MGNWRLYVNLINAGKGGTGNMRSLQKITIILLLATLALLTACGRQGVKESSDQTAALSTAVDVMATADVDAAALAAPAAQTSKDIAAARAYSGKAPLPPDIQKIKNRGKLVVAMYYLDRLPFFYVDKQGQMAGVEVEMAHDIAAWLGVEVEFDRQAHSFDEVVDRVVKGQADVGISKLSVTMARALRAGFTRPYVTFYHALLVNRLQLAKLQAAHPGQSILQLLSQGTHKIGVRGASAWMGYARQLFPKAQLVSVENMTDLVQAAADGDVLAVLYDEFEIKNYMRQNSRLNIELKMVMLTEYIDPIGIAVAPQNQHLLAWLNMYLEYGARHLQIDELRRQYGPANESRGDVMQR